MTVEQRKFPRRSLRMAAKFTGETLKNIDCAITDYCANGLCLEILDREDYEVLEFMKEQEIVQVSFNFSQKDIEIFGLAVRIAHGSLGMRLIKVEVELMSILEKIFAEQCEVYQQNYAKLSLKKSSSEEEGDRRVESLNEYDIDLPNCVAVIVNKFVRYCLQGTFQKATDSLLSFAKHARSSAAMDSAFQRSESIEKGAKILETKMLDKSMRDLWLFFHGDEKTGDEKDNQSTSQEKVLELDSRRMNLLPDSELQIWVKTRVLSNRYERHFREVLAEIEIRIAYLMGREIETSCNPIAPAAFCHRFFESIYELDLNTETKMLLIKIFEGVCLKKLGRLYRAINKTLKAKGVLPNIKKSKVWREKIERSVVDHFSFRNSGFL